MEDKYVLEYNKEQDAYHIQTIEERRNRSEKSNIEWIIVDAGSRKQLNAECDRRRNK